MWEELWGDTAGPDRRYYQALIQAAVALFHFGNGNVRGALRLYHSSRDYMKPYLPKHEGLDVADFEKQMDQCFAELRDRPDSAASVKEELIPTVRLDPEPRTWPDPEAFLRKD